MTRVKEEANSLLHQPLGTHTSAPTPRHVLAMPITEPTAWSDQVRRILERYEEPLLRQVSAQLIRPRSQWPVEELVERNTVALSNAAVIDRRLEGLEPPGRRLLALIGHSRQPRWPLGNLVELLVALGHPVDMQPVFALLEAGLLYPDLPERLGRLKNFEQWLGLGQPQGPVVFAHPLVTARALGENLGLPECPGLTPGGSTIHEADGLELPLRLNVMWQQVAAGSLRRTQQGDFFKRDLDRLRTDPLLNGPPADGLADLPDAGLLAVELALVEGLLLEKEGEITATLMSGTWEQDLPATLASLLAAVPCLQAWNAREGWRGPPSGGNPYPSAYLLALLLLARLPEGGWADPAAVEQWVLSHHPFWAPRPAVADTETEKVSKPAPEPQRAGVSSFLLGLAYQLRLLQATRTGGGEWVVRLAPLGRWLLGLGDLPPLPAPYAQTVLVQPNLEIVAYRQGLTPSLLARLGQFAVWKNLGAACTLQLQPETVYRALEGGQTFAGILQTLEQHGMRPMPTPVVDLLRTWADKRDRLGVYPAATLFEFHSAEDLGEALARGLPGVRLSDRLAVVASENDIDFRHFRLAGTRDYGLPPEKCIDVQEDGVTLAVDLARSDLLVETELRRFAEALEGAGANGRRQYRLTPASLAQARDTGVSLRSLEEWFLQRTGQPLSPAARLLLVGHLVPPLTLRRQLVLHLSTAEVADGLLQWPATRELIQARLGPTTLVVAEENVPELQNRLQALGLNLQPE